VVFVQRQRAWCWSGRQNLNLRSFDPQARTISLTRSNGDDRGASHQRITLAESWPVGGSLKTLAPRIGSRGSSWAGEATPMAPSKTKVMALQSSRPLRRGHWSPPTRTRQPPRAVGGVAGR
jgi:hypothetical protein